MSEGTRLWSSDKSGDGLTRRKRLAWWVGEARTGLKSLGEVSADPYWPALAQECPHTDSLPSLGAPKDGAKAGVSCLCPHSQHPAGALHRSLVRSLGAATSDTLFLPSPSPPCLSFSHHTQPTVSLPGQWVATSTFLTEP